MSEMLVERTAQVEMLIRFFNMQAGKSHRVSGEANRETVNSCIDRNNGDIVGIKNYVRAYCNEHKDAELESCFDLCSLFEKPVAEAPKQEVIPEKPEFAMAVLENVILQTIAQTQVGKIEEQIMSGVEQKVKDFIKNEYGAIERKVTTVVDVYYNITAGSFVKSDKLTEAGTKILSAIISLEQQGYRFNLYALQTYFDGDDCYMLKIKVKDAMQPIDLKRISFPLAHTGFFRVIGFDWYSKCPKAKYISCYGRSIDYDHDMTKYAKELFGDNAVWFGSVKVIKQDEEYIKGVLQNVGKN